MSIPRPHLLLRWLSSPLESIPCELLERIILHALHDDGLGPPTRLPVYLSLSKNIHRKLSDNPAFFRQIFLQKFDLTAPLRRFGPDYITSPAILSELKSRSSLLIRIRNFHSFSSSYPLDHHNVHLHLERDLWKLVLMLLENDGLNHAHLIRYANLPRFMTLWAAHFLAESYHDYPPENTVISLGLYLLWRVQVPESVSQDALSNNYSLMRAISPYNIAAFKYANAFAPDIHLYFPVDASQISAPDSLAVPLHTYPIYRPFVNYRASQIDNPPPNSVSSAVSHFDINLRLTPPLAYQSSLLLFFTYHEVRGIQPTSQTPATRAERDQIGLRQPSREDLEEHNRYAGTRFIPPSPPDGFSDQSERFDEDFQRLLWCGNPFDEPCTAQVYKLGSLTGLWEGRVLYPEVMSYQGLLASSDYPESFDQFFLFTSPFKVRIKEWYCPTDTDAYILPYPMNDPGDGLRSAWLPQVNWRFFNDQVEVCTEDEKHVYLAYQPGETLDHDVETCSYCDPVESESGIDDCEPYRYAGAFLPPTSECKGYLDIIITGETDPEHAKAWGNYKFFGRIRRYDGLIVMYREPADPSVEAGRWVFRGYLSSDQNFVGRVRDGASDPRQPGVIEGSFTLNKRMGSS